MNRSIDRTPRTNQPPNQSDPNLPPPNSTCAVLNLVACCGIGVTASKARVLDPAAVSALSRLVYNVFQPSLLFTNVMQTLAAPASAGDQSKVRIGRAVDSI